jgi:YidC/Oxa1 family membrane protein insertase
MEKRLLLAVVLSVAVLLLWDLLTPKHPVKPAGAGAPVSTASPAPPAPAPPAAASSTAAAPAPAAAPVRAEPVPAATHANQEERIVVDRPLYRATFSNRGALLVSFVLKKYDDDQGNPLEMVHREPGAAVGTLGFEFVSDAAATKTANTSLYEVTRSSSPGAEGLAFRYSGGGQAFEKRFRMGSGYLFEVQAATPGRSEPFELAVGPGLRNLSEKEKANRFTNMSGAVWFDGNGAIDIARTRVDAVRDGALPEDGYVGLEDNYFLAVLLPRAAAAWRVSPVGKGKEIELRAGPVASRELTADAYIGPKDLDVLESYHRRLEASVSFKAMGINLGLIARPLIWLMKASHRYLIPNWGVAILVVTFLLRLLLFPLMQKSYVGMKKMQKLQPKINAIKSKYKKAKSDAEQRNRMNKEMMALYQSEGYNPMSGCLPMLLQMPILFAFYVLLEKAIELRHAPFYFWIHDLSAKDPTYILVVVMIVSMFVQQLMTPSTADPAQKKLFLIMPLFWGFFLKDMPAGLVLYWLFSNILTIGQQMLINRMYRDEPAPVRHKSKKPAAEG